MYNNNGNPLITALHSVLLAPDLCDGLFSIITSMNLGHTCLFHKGFCTVYILHKKKNAGTLPHIAQRKHAVLVKIKEMSKSKKIAPIKKRSLVLLHHRLGHRYTIQLIDGDAANVCQDIELRIYPDPFFTSC